MAQRKRLTLKVRFAAFMLDGMMKPSTHSGGADIGLAVRRIHKRMGLAHQCFAEELRVTPLTVHRWETGQSRPQRPARERLWEFEAALVEDGVGRNATATPPDMSPPLDFAGDPEAVSAVAEALRLAHCHQFNLAFASETARPLPHQRIAVYEHMLPHEPLRFLLADDVGAAALAGAGSLRQAARQTQRWCRLHRLRRRAAGGGGRSLTEGVQ